MGPPANDHSQASVAICTVSHPIASRPSHLFFPAQIKEEKSDAGYSKQQLILGTHTSEGEQNYLMRAEVQLPLEESETDGR